MVDCSTSCSAIINYPGSFGPALPLRQPLIPAVQRGRPSGAAARCTGWQQSFELPPTQGPALYQFEKKGLLLPPPPPPRGGGGGLQSCFQMPLIQTAALINMLGLIFPPTLKLSIIHTHKDTQTHTVTHIHINAQLIELFWGR